MSASESVGVQLDAALAGLATKQDLDSGLESVKSELRAELRAAVKEIVAVVNANTEALRDDLNKAGVPVKTMRRGSAE